MYTIHAALTTRGPRPPRCSSHPLAPRLPSALLPLIALWLPLTTQHAMAARVEAPTRSSLIAGLPGAGDSARAGSHVPARAPGLHADRPGNPGWSGRATVGETPCTPSGATPTSPVSATLNGWKVSIDAESGQWQIVPPGEVVPVMSGPGACVRDSGDALSGARIATGQPAHVRAFGAFRIDLEGHGSSMNWYAVTGGAGKISTAATSITLTWPAVSGAPGDIGLRFSTRGTRDLEVHLVSSASGLTGGEISLSAGESESFFGLGTQVVGLDLRGHTFPLWSQEGGIGKPDGHGVYPLTNLAEAAYAPMGIWHSSAGYSALLTEDSYSEIDLGETHPDRVALRTFGALPGFVLVPGTTPRARLTALSDYLGRLSEPPPWVLGPWNDAFGGPDRLYDVVGELRVNHIPSSAIWSEDWAGLNPSPTGGLSYDWSWAPEVYPNLPSDIAYLHGAGFAFMGYYNTFVPRSADIWDEGRNAGYFIHRDDGDNYYFLDALAQFSSLVDTTNPDAVAWMQDYMAVAMDEVGLDGWMADYGEWLPADARMANGEDGWTHHNRYTLDWQRLNQEAMAATVTAGEVPDKVFFARSGWASTQGGTAGLIPALWGGDQNTTWAVNDGFPSAVAIGANVGLGGVAIYGSDVAGYTHVYNKPTTKELFLRWSEFGAFSPLMRTHHGQDECSNWAFDRDAETLQHFRRYATVHALLQPYLWTLVLEAMDDGLPVMRHPWLVEPDRPGLWSGQDYEYFLGDDLLVAPVLQESATSRAVVLPGTGWWPLFGAAPLTGEQPAAGQVYSLTVPAAVTEIPAYVRPGSVLPLLGSSIDSLYGASQAGVSDLADVAGFYTLALYPDPTGALAGTSVGTATISGSGWTSLNPAWSTARVNGQVLGPCDGVQASTSCIEVGGMVQLVGASMQLTVGSAQLTVSGSQVQRFRVAMAGSAWESWAQPTSVTNLNPDIPPPCK